MLRPRWLEKIDCKGQVGHKEEGREWFRYTKMLSVDNRKELAREKTL